MWQHWFWDKLYGKIGFKTIEFWPKIWALLHNITGVMTSLQLASIRGSLRNQEIPLWQGMKFGLSQVIWAVIHQSSYLTTNSVNLWSLIFIHLVITYVHFHIIKILNFLCHLTYNKRKAPDLTLKTGCWLLSWKILVYCVTFPSSYYWSFKMLKLILNTDIKKELSEDFNCICCTRD